MKHAALWALLLPNVTFGQVSDSTASAHTIHLVYDDSKISDAARAQVIAILARQPQFDLKTVVVTKADQGLTQLVQNNFHLSGKTDRLAVQSMVKSIQSLNGLATDRIDVGDTLLAPSLPTRVYRENDLKKPAFRVLASGADEITTASTPDQLTATDLEVTAQPRNGDLTAKEIADPRVLVERAWMSGSKPFLPDGVHPLEDGGDIRIRLADGPECATESWLEKSPFYPTMRKALGAYIAKPGTHEQLVAAAAALPLVVIDWNDSDKKHGQKVTSVVQYLLDHLDVGYLTFHEVDLNPANNSAELQGIFTEYVENYYCTLGGVDCNNKGQKALIDEVRRWLKSAPRSASGIASIKQLLLEAVLWKYFAASKAVVNMSFTVDSLALEIMQAQFLGASHSIAISAASDDLQAQGIVGIPQRAASIYPNFVNVTYGNSDGTLLGGFSNDAFNIFVTTIAQGCGFSFRDIASADSGTSFAAPYVATAIWLKALMAGGNLPHPRHDIVQASSVATVKDRPHVESSGPFDLASLLSPDQFFILRSDGSVTSLKSAKLVLRTLKENGAPVEQTYLPGEEVTVAFFHNGSDLVARVRAIQKEDSPLPVAKSIEQRVENVYIDFVPEDGGAPDHYDLQRIKDSVVEIKF